MTRTTDTVFRVLDKLRDAVLANKLRNGLQWEYDFATSYEDEDNALILLETRGVIKTIPGVVQFTVTPGGHLEYKGEATARQPELWSRTIEHINADAYEKVCSEYGLMPYENVYSATLRLVDVTIPVVIVGGSEYRLPALHSGKATDIIRDCFSKAGRSIGIDELRQNPDIKHLTSVSDTIRTSYFAPGGLLAPFASSSPKSATLLRKALLDKQQLADIQAVSK